MIYLLQFGLFVLFVIALAFGFHFLGNWLRAKGYGSQLDKVDKVYANSKLHKPSYYKHKN